MKISNLDSKNSKKDTSQKNIFDTLFYIIIGLLFGSFISLTIFYKIYPYSFVKVINTFNNNTGFGVYNHDISVLKDTLSNKLFSSPQNLPVINIDIKYKHWEKLNKKRNEALEKGILFTKNDDYVPAKIKINNQSMDIKMRLKGDWTDHLQDNKWSFRVKVKDGKQLFGLKKFSLQNPKVRGYQGQVLINSIFKQHNLITLKYFFVKVIINGKDIGIMALEEHFSKELLERNKKKNSVIVKLDESLLWETILADNFNEDAFEDYSNTFVSAFGKSKIYESKKLLKEYEIAVGLLRGFIEKKLKPSDVFDSESLGKFLAISDFFNSGHGVAWHNLRFYFNPYIMKLEPIPYDANLHVLNTKLKELPLTKEMLKDKKIKDVYLKTIKELNFSLEKGTLIKGLKSIENKYLKDLQSEFFLLDSYYYHHLKKKMFEEECYSSLKKNISTYLHSNLIQKNALSYLELSNSLCDDIEITSIYLEDSQNHQKKFDANKNLHFPLLLTKKKKDSLSTIISIPYQKQKETSYDIFIEAKIKNENKIIRHKAKPYFPTLLTVPFSHTSINELLSNHPYIKIDKSCEKCLIVEQGKWRIKKNIILPHDYNLTILDNTILEFEKDKVLLIFGKTNFLGTKEHPIILKDSNNLTWQGIAVLNSKIPSLWENVHIKNTQGIHFNLFKLSGGTSFYKSDITIKNSSFKGNKGEDALNIIHSNFKFDTVSVSNTFSDGFDADFATGEIINSTFHNIGFATGGDGVDLSGSNVTMKNSTFDTISDKAISIGENSQFNAKHLFIKNSSVAIASKDNSFVKIMHANIQSIKNTALMAYMKKPVYGGSKLFAENVVFSDVQEETKVQYESAMIVNNLKITPEKLDIKNMYKTIMKPMRKK